MPTSALKRSECTIISNMLRWRTPGVRELLLAFVLLNVVEVAVLNRIPGLWPGRVNWTGLVIGLFLTWRVSRGGRISQAWLILGAAAGYLRAISNVARFWNPLLAVLAVACVLQVLLLISPPVLARLEGRTELANWASVVPLLRRPPAWLLLGGLLAGVVITLIALGGGDWGAIPGCRPATSAACVAYSEGYPLRWLSAVQNTPVIDKGALLKDFAQWTLLAWSVLYAACYWILPSRYRSAQTSDAATFA
jgi:hypothetical protein